MYKVEIEHLADFKFKAKSGKDEMVIDAKSDGMTPPAALLAALGSCVGVYIRKYSEGAKLGLEGFSVNVEAEFSKEPPACFKSINIKIDLKGAVIEERRLKALIEFIKNCPVHNTLKADPLVEITVNK